MIKNISKHISYKEATKSITAIKLGIDNIPNSVQRANIIRLAENVFEPIRGYFKKPIAVTSMFRSEELNETLGGAKNSQHLANKGAAMDIDADIYGKVTNKDIFTYIYYNLEYDQLICEFPDDKGEPSWVHVSFNKDNNRKQTLIAYKENNKTKYKNYK